VLVALAVGLDLARPASADRQAQAGRPRPRVDRAVRAA
jgi:hypothetical protein